MRIKNIKLYNVFRSKSYKLCFGFFVVVLIVSSAGFLIFAEPVVNKSSEHQHQTYVRPVNDSNHEISIAKAQNYLLDRLHIVDPELRLMLDYLERKYSINENFSASVNPISVNVSPSGFVKEIDYVMRIAYPDRLILHHPDPQTEPVARMTIYAANCDHLGLPEDFSELVSKNIDNGSYELTHVALAMKLIQDNGCTLSEESIALTSGLATKIVSIASAADTVADLRYEAVAFLSLIGRKDLIKQEWVKEILNNQIQDGGWGRTVQNSRSDDHSTILALWALLEYGRPNVADEPIIRRPSR